MVDAIGAIRLISADAEALAAFYVKAFGFVRHPDGEASDAFSGPLRRLAVLYLADERLEIAEPMGPITAAPETSLPTSSFQHFAMVAPVMSKALARLDHLTGWTPITRGGPQILPPASGSVTAFKLRDPEGHPLEVLTFPPDATPARWRGWAGDTAGIDHTAIIVANTSRSLAFYSALGFARIGGSLNRGPEQAALDGMSDPEVEVTALGIPGAPPPHLELLCYRGSLRGAQIGDNDRLATRTIGTDGNTGIQDPDGHRWIVTANDPCQESCQ